MNFYKNMPGVICTGKKYEQRIKDEYDCDKYASGQLDAPDVIPAGSTKYCDWGVKWQIEPYHQEISYIWRE